MRIVLDTNVLISAFLSPTGYLGQILQAWHQQQFEVVVSQALLTEYAAALVYDRINQRLGFSPKQIEEIAHTIKNASICIEDVDTGLTISVDPDDNMLFSI